MIYYICNLTSHFVKINAYKKLYKKIQSLFGSLRINIFFYNGF